MKTQSWRLVANNHIEKSLRKKHKRPKAKHADQSKHSLWRNATKSPYVHHNNLKSSPAYTTHLGLSGLERFT